MVEAEIKAERRDCQFFDGIIPLGPDWHGCCSCPCVADGSSWEQRSPKPPVPVRLRPSATLEIENETGENT